MSVRGTVSRALDVARTELGYQETPVNITKYGAFAGQDGQAWCGNFVRWVLHEAGVPGWDADSPPGVGYTPTMAAYGKSTGTWWTDPADAKPGDVVLYQWPTLPKGRYGHTGIVEALEPGGIIAIEGNTNPGGASRTGGGVYRVRRRSNIAGGFTPDYRPEPVPAVDRTNPNWSDMATADEIRAIVHDEVVAILRAPEFDLSGIREATVAEGGKYALPPDQRDLLITQAANKAKASADKLGA